ncbi:myosin-11-like [Brienomyrus brachyistius]|uniref:myosin-11-like n=1 Tax=Brienomyrus brachyistius TaxID=42636 RepID=UPI0020B33407|nr:myosin-11-like [Brienomyrus brachyistius]
MIHMESPLNQWKDLGTWPDVVTSDFLPSHADLIRSKAADQIEDDIAELMAMPPTQKCGSKRLTKVLGSLTHKLLARLKINEKETSCLQQRVQALQQQERDTQQLLAETQRDAVQAQHRIKDLEQELQQKRSPPHEEEETEEGKRPQTSKKLQQALEELRAEADRREQQARATRENLEDKLDQADTLLDRAHTELKNKEGRVQALENHLAEAQRDAVQAQHRIKNLEQELQQKKSPPHEEEETEEGKKLQTSKKLQRALEELRAEADRREQQARATRENLEDRLDQADTLLDRAHTELKNKEGRIQALENHLAEAQRRLQKLNHQLISSQEQLIDARMKHQADADEIDRVRRELKQAYEVKLELETPDESEAEPTSSPAVRYIPRHSGVPPRDEVTPCPSLDLEDPRTRKVSPREDTPDGPGLPKRTPHQHRVTTKELDKVARNINTFIPNPRGGHDIHAYLQDIDFHLQRLDRVTNEDRVYLIRITSSLEVRSFLDRQPSRIRADAILLHEALTREFADPESEQGIAVALDVKQNRQEAPQAYYNRLRRAYFGSRNEPGMEEDANFKALFLRNLHPTITHYLGLMACPHTMTSQQLRDLAIKAYHKQRAAAEKATKATAVLNLGITDSNLALEGGHPHPQPPIHDRGWTAASHSERYPGPPPQQLKTRPDRWEAQRSLNQGKPRPTEPWNKRGDRLGSQFSNPSSPLSSRRNQPRNWKDRRKSYEPDSKPGQTTEKDEWVLLQLLRDFFAQHPLKGQEDFRKKDPK